MAQHERFPIYPAERRASHFHRNGLVVVYLDYQNPDIIPAWRNSFVSGRVEKVQEKKLTVILDQAATWSGVFVCRKDSPDVMRLGDWVFFLNHQDEYWRWLNVQDFEWMNGQMARLQAYYNATGQREPVADRQNLWLGDPVVTMYPWDGYCGQQPLRHGRAKFDRLLFGNLTPNFKNSQVIVRVAAQLSEFGWLKVNAPHYLLRNPINGVFLLPRWDYELMRHWELKRIERYFEDVPDPRWLRNGQFLLSSFSQVPTVNLTDILRIQP